MSDEYVADPYHVAFVKASDAVRNAKSELDTLTAYQESELASVKAKVATAGQEMETRREELYDKAIAAGIINRRLVDVLAPTHESTMCKVDDASAGAERCIRCFLLDAIHHPHEHALRGVKLHVRISRPHR